MTTTSEARIRLEFRVDRTPQLLRWPNLTRLRS
jgi:hypothetical protein